MSDTDFSSEIRSQLPALAAATGAPTPGDGRALPSLPIVQPLASLCREVGQCLRPAPFFRKGASYVTVNDATGELKPMTPNRFRSWHQRFFLFHEGEGDKRRTVNARQDLAVCILESDELRSETRELRAVNTLRLPVWRGEGETRKLELLPTGYDCETKTFTVPLLDYPTDWTLAAALEWFKKTFGEFPFYESGDLLKKRSFSATVAAMLGIYGVNLLPASAVRPMVLIIGNQPGVGKSRLMRAILSPVHGVTEEDSKPRSDEELRNVLDAAALAGAPYVFIDDVRNMNSNDLNHFISSPTHTPRIKGKSERMKCANVWQVCATGNDLRVSEDLARRSLPIFLIAAEKASERKIQREITDTWLFSPEYRAPACAALWALLSDWFSFDAIRSPEARKPSFEDYASLVGSVCMSAALANPFGAVDWITGGDDATASLERAICHLAGKAAPGDSFTPTEIQDHLKEMDELDVVVAPGKEPLRVIGQALRKLRKTGRIFTDVRGRRFSFSKGENGTGTHYMPLFEAGE